MMSRFFSVVCYETENVLETFICKCRCVAAKGDTDDCQKFAKYYRSLCPGEWVSSFAHYAVILYMCSYMVCKLSLLCCCMSCLIIYCNLNAFRWFFSWLNRTVIMSHVALIMTVDAMKILRLEMLTFFGLFHLNVDQCSKFFVENMEGF